MTQLPKVKQALLNSLTAKKILNSRAGQQTRHILSQMQLTVSCAVTNWRYQGKHRMT